MSAMQNEPPLFQQAADAIQDAGPRVPSGMNPEGELILTLINGAEQTLSIIDAHSAQLRGMIRQLRSHLPR